jgi:hypothetical protein
LGNREEIGKWENGWKSGEKAGEEPEKRKWDFYTLNSIFYKNLNIKLHYLSLRLFILFF